VPSKINQILVSDSTRIVICFGCNDLGTYDSTPLDPLLIRWSAQESYTNWTPAATNQAGGFRLSRGSEIVSAIQTRQEILVWTDAAIYSMQYIGPPLVWGFTLLADNISIVSQNAMATAAGVVYWMGVDKFYIYSGRVETLPCSVRQFVFTDINRAQEAQFFASTNEGFSEIWWFYCSTKSTVIDRYVVYNYLDRVWYYGILNRTAWLDSGIRQNPMGAFQSGIDGLGNPVGRVLYHEIGNDDSSGLTPVPIYAYVQSSDFDIGDGHNFGFVWRMLPDVNFNGSNVNEPYVTMELQPRQNSGTSYQTSDTPVVTSENNYVNFPLYTVQQFTGQVYTRLRGRQMAFKISSDSIGVAWQLGTPRIDIKNDGRR
jgi:hypothetical protein